jgi:hypothetical protein
LKYSLTFCTETFQVPQNAADWLAVSDEFWRKWNYPNCIGALDGKHVVIVKPSKSGSIFMNYKQTFSLVLMAVVDANYKFPHVCQRGSSRENK